MVHGSAWRIRACGSGYARRALAADEDRGCGERSRWTLGKTGLVGSCVADGDCDPRYVCRATTGANESFCLAVGLCISRPGNRRVGRPAMASCETPSGEELSVLLLSPR